MGGLDHKNNFLKKDSKQANDVSTDKQATQIQATSLSHELDKVSEMLEECSLLWSYADEETNFSQRVSRR